MNHQNRVMQQTTTTGTGSLTLGASVAGFKDFAAAFGASDTFYYCIDAGASYEIGKGHIAAGLLVRDTLVESSTGAFLNLAAGTKKVFTTVPAQRLTDLGWDKLTNLQIGSAIETVVPITPANYTAAIVLDLSLGRVFKITLANPGVSQIWNISFTNVPQLDNAKLSVEIYITNTQPGMVTVNMPSGWNWGSDYNGGPTGNALSIFNSSTAGVQGVTLDKGSHWMGSAFGRGW